MSSVGKRIIVLGCSGSGKSTFARKLQAQTGLPLVHLDNIWWKADRTHISREEFDCELESVLSKDRWILDGDFSRTYEPRFRACDTVIFLDFDEETCMNGIVERVGKERPDIPWVEHRLDPELVALVRNYRRDNRPAVYTLLTKYPNRYRLIFHTRREADRWLLSIDQEESRMDKKALRREIGEKKRALSAAEIEARSAVLADKLFQTEQYRDCKSLYAYLSFNQEVRTDPIIQRAWADGKRVAVPKVIGDEMVFIWIGSFESLAPQGAFGITEPIENGPVTTDEKALILMPGLAFDPQGHRVGYGGGYYDRYLAAHPHHPTVALCYDFQLFGRLDVDDYDVPVDLIITDE